MSAPPPAPTLAEERPGLLRRLLPRPWTVLWLWLAWLLLNQSLEPGHLLLGLALALVCAPFATRGRGAPATQRSAARRLATALGLAAIVTWDIVVANVQVAMLILGRPGSLRSRFVWVTLDVERPRSIALLAGIITMTPGTVSAELSDDRRHLLVHALDVADPDALVAQIKSRYEARIKETFE